jgi:hypothetical protein
LQAGGHRFDPGQLHQFNFKLQRESFVSRKSLRVSRKVEQASLLKAESLLSRSYHEVRAKALGFAQAARLFRNRKPALQAVQIHPRVGVIRNKFPDDVREMFDNENRLGKKITRLSIAFKFDSLPG